jgi:hypothetical protein
VTRSTSGPTADPLAAGTGARFSGNGRIRSGGDEFRVRFSEATAPEPRARIDEAYRVKYGRYGSSNVSAMTSDSADETTLQLEPAG